ncbi:AMP-binding protein [Streptomyces sp. NPDC003077]|uniref:AMP-binding protein n=1 Tax=Streptomyces sp. NPDC003077 TaxID=3154443 RepID=UPI0033A7A843
MPYRSLTPKELLYRGNADTEVNDTSWSVRWEAVDERQVLDALPAELEFHTSGSTGPSRCWRRTREAAWQEAGMLAEFVTQGAASPPGAVVAFAPPLHVYGALATFLMPARLGVPVWYRKEYVGALPETGQRHAVVVATPWIFSLLLRHIDWVRSFEHLTVLYSSAMLPADAGRLLQEAGPGRVTLIELLGSTETGGIATRRWQGGEPPAWTLFPDVTRVEREAPGTDGADGTDGAVPLVIRGPRLAHQPGEPRPAEWHTGDLVEPLDARTFRLVGRVGRLVKVNGRRVNLDEAEHALRGRLDCADLALVPVNSPMIGEHVDVYVVPSPGAGADDLDLSPVVALLGARPRRVHVVPEISRSALGKLRPQRTPPHATASE